MDRIRKEGCWCEECEDKRYPIQFLGTTNST